jgi:hypothetical protein
VIAAAIAAAAARTSNSINAIIPKGMMAFPFCCEKNKNSATDPYGKVAEFFVDDESFG